MRVRELIAALRECDPAAEAVCRVSWDDRVVRINSVAAAGAEGNVVLSDSVPQPAASKADSAETRKRHRRKGS